MDTRLLISGFAPFGKETVNASWEAVRALPDKIEGAEIRKVCLPVEYRQSWECLRESIVEFPPEVVICVGQATGRSCVTPEKVAINWMSAAIPDNAGIIASGEKVCSSGPDAYFSTFSPEKIVSALRDEKIPAEISYSAGTYVCNSLLYQLLYFVTTRGLPIRGGFIHVPCLPEQALPYSHMPSMGLPTLTAALTAAIRTQI